VSDVNYVLGLDLGQSQDPTALAVVRRLGAFGFEDTELYQVGHLERLPLGTSYPAVVGHVKWVLEHLPKGTELVVDYTGVGRPIFDLFVDIPGIDPIGVLITGGNTESNFGRIFSVPKINLISWLQALLHQERLKIQRELPEASALVRELREFRVDFTAAGHMTFNARSGQHDDLLLALAIAAWRARVGEAPALLTFYRNQMELAKRQDRGVVPVENRAFEQLPWQAKKRQVVDDAQELIELYWSTLAGLQQSDVCASCGKELGATKISDGISRWHPDCPVPR
jgi:hypothetical protein